jgi:hypothetical protein
MCLSKQRQEQDCCLVIAPKITGGDGVRIYVVFYFTIVILQRLLSQSPCSAEYHSFPRASIHVTVRLHSTRPSMIAYDRGHARFKQRILSLGMTDMSEGRIREGFMARSDPAAQLGINGSNCPTSKTRIQSPRQVAQTLDGLTPVIAASDLPPRQSSPNGYHAVPSSCA